MATDNTGDRNTGDRNTGNWNTGDWNTGHRNTGHLNTGHMNTGDLNTGDLNTGDRNAGHMNTGHMNTGDLNTGDRNTGDLNTGDRNTGFFCENTPSPMFFDMPTTLTWEEAANAIPYIELPVCVTWVETPEMTAEEKARHPTHATTGGFLRSNPMPIQKSFPIAWAKMDNATRQRFIDLPNFSADKFERLTGVLVKLPRKIKVRLSGGEVVEGVEVE